ncbi:xanthine dehydrogenase accessory protein XdhC [Agaribacter flavus]|uniref:Xanthine dehydrogenase accessory protein XdhC n=1 Tax=Agaribacter flavus TaxID=1902781 RepID=A0ABV7FME9_9ALTE
MTSIRHPAQAGIPINTWFEALYRCQQQGQAYVLITVLHTAGSTPREGGTKMLITEASQFDTIGGGHLEYEAIQEARSLLADGTMTQKIVSYPLSSKLGQCCGGAMKLLFEVHTQHTQHLAVFGAGHVAQALVPILAQLPLQIKWIDNREDYFQGDMHAEYLPNVKKIFDDDPCIEMENLPKKAWAVILTHNHQLDYDLVETGIKQGKLSFLGMIGSETKAKRFKCRLANRGYTPEQISTLVSPIGCREIAGKRPIEVAVSISAQLIKQLQLKEQTSNESAELPSFNASHEQTV